MLYYALFVILVALTNGQITIYGECPNVQVVENFDVSRYMGTWYQEQRYPIVIKPGQKCISTRYEDNPNGTITATNYEIDVPNKNVTLVGLATFINSTSEAKLTITFGSTSEPYWVVGTDYENYAVVWSCTNWLRINRQYLWITTRVKQPSQQVLDDASKVVQNNKLAQQYLNKVDQTDCEL